MEIGVLNYTSKISDSDVAWMVRACNYQMINHLAPAYGREPWTITLYSDVDQLPNGSIYPAVLLDSADEPDALGYHTDLDGLIYSRVFANPVFADGGSALTGRISVSSVLSHEVCEMFADPDVTLWAVGTPRKEGNQYAYEICDPVQADSYSVTVGSLFGKRAVNVSNFVTPDWFKLNPIVKPTQYDYLKRLSAPFTMSPGGYMIVKNSQDVESNVFGQIPPPAWVMATKKHKQARTSKRGVK